MNAYQLIAEADRLQALQEEAFYRNPARLNRHQFFGLPSEVDALRQISNMRAKAIKMLLASAPQ